MARVLIVDHRPDVVARLREALEGGGLDVALAADGPAALAKTDLQSFDLVIASLDLPGMSGGELCRALKSRSGARALPVVLIVARHRPEDVVGALACGADNVCSVPFDPQRLLARVRALVRGSARGAGEAAQPPVEVSLSGHTFSVASAPAQILDFLVATLEDAADAALDPQARRREDRLRGSEARYRAIFEGIAEGVLLLDADLVVRSANPAARAMFGRTAEELEARPLRALVPERLRHAVEAIRARTQPAGRAGVAAWPSPVEIVGCRRDGSEFPLSLSLGEVAAADESLLVAITRDLSAERAAEQRLLHAEKMEAMGQLTGGVAHDFNNLLTVIAGNAEELSERVAERPELADLAASIGAAARRGAELTSRLLAFARRQALDPRPTDVNGLVAGMLDLLRRTLGESIGVRWRPGADVWNALVDPVQLEASLLNLAINARDAIGPGGGQLSVETGTLTVGPNPPADEPAPKPGDYVVVTVSDTGEGIPAALLPRVLEPFFTTKPLGEGTGMGLPMVYGFMEQSGGHLAIRSTPGEGTTVRLYLPRAADAGVRAPPARETAVGAGETILLVEDDELVRRYAQDQLESLGYRVLVACDGPSGLRTLLAHPEIDLLFTDVVMPGGMSGKQLADEVRLRRPALPVLFTSGYAEDAIVHHGRLDPGVRLLGKPYRRAQLARSIREAIDGR